MKLNVSLTLLLIPFSLFIKAQETNSEPKGAVTGKVFFNYHIDATKDAVQKSAFELERIYLGYKYTFNEEFTATILFDAGNGSGGSDFTVFVKNAKLDYTVNDRLTLTAGLFGMKQFDDQEKFWGYRYLYKTLDDEFKLGTSADLGVGAEIKISDQLSSSIFIVNGDGYKNLQDPEGRNRYGTKLVYKPNDNWIFKGYYDFMSATDIDTPETFTTLSNFTLFAGYNVEDHFRIGAEYNILLNGETFSEPAADKNLQGLSFYSIYIINNKWNVFGRFDQLSSNTLSGENQDWNFSEDGDLYIIGFEYKPLKNINTSVNYRYSNFKDPSFNNASFIYFNLEFYF